MSGEQKAPRSNVLYIGHLPHGFFETQLRSYFEQFGDISRLRLARSPKTGNSRQYAFIEFRDAEVARIAAEAMNGYLMLGRELVCHTVDLSKEEGRDADDIFKYVDSAKSRQNFKFFRRQRLKTEQQRAAKADERLAATFKSDSDSTSSSVDSSRSDANSSSSSNSSRRRNRSRSPIRGSSSSSSGARGDAARESESKSESKSTPLERLRAKQAAWQKMGIDYTFVPPAK